MDKLTENQEKILNLMKEKYADGAFADEMAENENLVVASVRATLTSLEKKGLLNKEDADYQGKIKKRYTVK